MAPGVLSISGPEQHLGEGGGGAVGSGPGVALGSALALQGSGKLPVGVFGDGDFLSSNQALWTAAHYRIPSLWVLKNNRSYYNDENHQDVIARIRERPVENKVIAMRMEDPEIDFAGMARTFGVAGEGPITEASQLAPALQRAVEQVKEGALVVVDVRIENRDRG
jgi:thiamine pyrophosphate-dependent acetolactate synthase large subunit-like protein